MKNTLEEIARHSEGAAVKSVYVVWERTGFEQDNVMEAFLKKENAEKYIASLPGGENAYYFQAITLGDET